MAKCPNVSPYSLHGVWSMQVMFRGRQHGFSGQVACPATRFVIVLLRPVVNMVMCHHLKHE